MLLRIFSVVAMIGVASSSPVWASCERVTEKILQLDASLQSKLAEFESLPSDPLNKSWVKAKIHFMVEIDQDIRMAMLNWPASENYSEEERQCFLKEIAGRMERVDIRNTSDLTQLMKIYNWFKQSDFGAETSHEAWLIAQHADRNPDFQRQVLKLMKDLWPIKEVAARDYAYLLDRVTWYADKHPQIYATQGRCVNRGNWQPWETEDFKHVDERRALMGMETFLEYKKRVDAYCK